MSTPPSIDADTIRALLLSARRARSAPRPAPANVQPFDFHAPHRFPPDALRRLREAAEVMARDLTATLSATLRGAFPIALVDIQEVYVHRLPSADAACYLPLRIADRLAGYLLLPLETAVGWVTKLLGGLADVEVPPGRTLSTLETDLLLDITKKIIEAISRASTDNGGPTITHTPKISLLPLELVEEGQIADVCRIAFQRKEGAKPLPFSLVIFSELLEPLGGMARPTERSLEEVQQDMLEHVQTVAMELNVRLATVPVSMRDLVALEPGDVILLPKPMDEPIDVIVCGKAIMTGRPVQYKGWYGLQICRVKEEA